MPPTFLGERTEGVVEKVTPVGFEPTPFRNGALSHRLRPLGQSVLGSQNIQMDPARDGAVRASAF